MKCITCGTEWPCAVARKSLGKEASPSPAPTSTVAPDTGAAASGVMGPVVTPEDARDAARYRWLRDTPPWNSTLVVISLNELPDDAACFVQNRLDLAIDAARSAPAVPTGVADE